MARIKEITPPMTQNAVMRRVLWEIKNNAHLLEPMTYNNIKMHANRGNNCLTVPLSAMADAERDTVFVVKPDGIVEKRTVETGADDGKYIEVASGLKDGEIVILDSFDGLADGVKVEITLEEGEK